MPSGSDKEAFERDYYEWPVEDSAPWIDVDKDGKYTFGKDTPGFLREKNFWKNINSKKELKNILYNK